jgi:hypothetical protein
LTGRAYGRPCDKNRRMTRRTGEASETTGGVTTIRTTQEKPFTPNRPTPVPRFRGHS